MKNKHLLAMVSLFIISCSPPPPSSNEMLVKEVYSLLPDALAEEVAMFETFLKDHAFSHLAKVEINTLSVRPFQSDSQVCLSLSYLSIEGERSESAPVCYLFKDGVELHFSFTRVFSDDPQHIAHIGKSFNDKPLDVQFDIMLSLYDRGLYQMATQAI